MNSRSGYFCGHFSQMLLVKGDFMLSENRLWTGRAPYGHHSDRIREIRNLLKFKKILPLWTVRTPYMHILMCVRARGQVINSARGNLSRTLGYIYGVLVSKNKKNNNFQLVI